MSRETRVVFIGTPDFAVPTLEALIRHYAVVGVVTQPDRPAGRGRSERPSPVKQCALAHGLPVFQPVSLRKPDAVLHLSEWAPDLFVTVATGYILTAAVLALPAQGTLNVHASLLPRWRGAAPIQAAVLAGDTQTGVTILCTDEGLDTGPILRQRTVPIGIRDTALALHDKLAKVGADLLLDTLPSWLSGELLPRPQPGEGVTYAPQIRKEDGLISWDATAVEIDRQVRAFAPWPAAFTFWRHQRLKVVAAQPSPSAPFPLIASQEPSGAREPGTVVLHGMLPAVITGHGILQLDQLQLEGKRVLSGEAFVRGRPDFIGARLGKN